jgi:excisionase family DNA binding protein
MNDKGTNMNETKETKYYTYPEAAQLLRCSEKTLYNRVRNGDIQPLRNGRLVLFTDECLEDFLKRGYVAVRDRPVQLN